MMKIKQHQRLVGKRTAGWWRGVMVKVVSVTPLLIQPQEGTRKGQRLPVRDAMELLTIFRKV